MASSRTLRRQAQAEATLRTAPEASVLREMLMQAISDRDTAIAAATGAAHGVTSAVNKAGPSLKKAYGDAIDQSHGTAATVDATLSSMGASAGPVQAAMARERGAGADRLSASLASALSELSNRRVEAAAGRAQATNAALSGYSATKDKLTRQASDLANQSGLYASTRYGELTADERKAKRDAHDKAVQRRFTAQQNAKNRRNSRLTSGVDAQGQVIPGGPKDPKVAGKKPLTQDQRNTRNKNSSAAQDAVAGARIWINRLRGGSKPLGDEQIKELLTTGAPAKTVTRDVPVIDPITKKVQTDPHGQTKTRQETVKGDPVPKTQQAFIKAAFEMEDQGYLSKQTVHELRVQNVHVPKEWLPVVVKGHIRKPKAPAVKKLTRQVQQGVQDIVGTIKLNPVGK